MAETIDVTSGRCLDAHHIILIDISAFFSTRLDVEHLASHLLKDIPPFGAAFVHKYSPGEVIPEWRIVALDVMREWCTKTSAIGGARGGKLLKVLCDIGKEDAASRFHQELLGGAYSNLCTAASNAARRQWLAEHESVFVDLRIPVDKLLACLSSAVDFPSAESERIERAKTPSDRVHRLCAYLKEAGSWAIQPFKKALCEVCPFALSYIRTLNELHSESNVLYQSEEGDKQLTWLDASQGGASEYLHLSAVSVEEADRMIAAERAASTAGEQEHRDYVYSLPDKHKIVELPSIFRQEAQHDGERVQSLDECHEPGMQEIAASAGACDPSTLSFPWRSSTMQDKRIGIYGGAGCGKTCCCLKIVCQCASGELWPFFRLVLFWKLRDPEVRDAKNLEELLRVLGLNPSRCKDYADILEESGGWGVLALCDGIDELPQEDTFVMKVLLGSVLPKACVVATSRPCRAAKRIFRDARYRQLELLGFREDQISMFVQQRLSPGLASQFTDFQKKNPSLASLMFVPLLAFLACEVFRDSPSSPPTTRTDLYSQLVALMVRRSTADGRVKGLTVADEDCLVDVKDFRSLTGKPRELILKIAHVAYLASKDNKPIFGRNLLDRAKCCGEAIQLGFISSQSSKISEQFSFHHLTFQEFFTAYHLANKAETERDVGNVISTLGFARHQHVVWQFFSGLLREDLRTFFFAQLNDWLHSNYNYQFDRTRCLLRFCLQCAKEVSDGDVSVFPPMLHLPARVVLQHVTAADMAQLAGAVQGSRHLTDLVLWFDSVVESKFEKESVSRLKVQTRKAMTKLMAAVYANKSLSNFFLSGPKYNLFEKEGWMLLLETIQKNSLQALSVCYCSLDDSFVQQLSTVLSENPPLTWLDLSGSDISDVGARCLAKDLKNNRRLKMLDLRWNVYDEETHQEVVQLRNIPLVHSA